MNNYNNIDFGDAKADAMGSGALMLHIHRLVVDPIVQRNFIQDLFKETRHFHLPKAFSCKLFDLPGDWELINESEISILKNILDRYNCSYNIEIGTNDKENLSSNKRYEFLTKGFNITDITDCCYCC